MNEAERKETVEEGTGLDWMGNYCADDDED
jgi:hypothetical protein